MRILSMILVIGLLTAGCGTTDTKKKDDNGKVAVERPKKKAPPKKPPVKVKKEPRPAPPAKVTAKAKTEIAKQIAILSKKKSKPEEKMKALDALIGIGPTASPAVLKLIRDKSGASLILYVDRFYRNGPPAATDWLLWALTSHDAKERAAAQRILQGLCVKAQVKLASGADMKARTAAAAAWKKVLKEQDDAR